MTATGWVIVGASASLVALFWSFRCRHRYVVKWREQDEFGEIRTFGVCEACGKRVKAATFGRTEARPVQKFSGYDYSKMAQGRRASEQRSMTVQAIHAGAVYDPDVQDAPDAPPMERPTDGRVH